MIVPYYQIQELWAAGALKDIPLKIDLTPPEEDQPNPLYLKDLTPETVAGLAERKTSHVILAYNPHLRDILENKFQVYYHPAYRDKLSMIRMLLQQFSMSNDLSKGRKLSFRQRQAKSLISVPDRENKSSLIRFNAPLTAKDIEILRSRLSDEYILPYTLSEKGILLVYDAKGYLDNPILSRLQFQVRKIFHDIRYKRVFPTDVATAFPAWFKTVEGNAPKLLVLCGKTPSNLFLFRQIKVFDPFAKTMWLTPDDLAKDADEVFDRILPNLGADYAYESLLCDPEDTSKDPLPQNDVKDLRERISRLSREFTLKGYIDLEFELLDRMKRHTVATQLNHLASVLDGMKVTKDAIFTKLLEGFLG